MIQQQPLLSFPPKMPLPHPQLLPQLLPHPQPLLPPQKKSRRMIQIQLPHPHPLLFCAPAVHPQSLEHPQFVAVKSLILLPPKGLFMVYSMHGGLSMFLVLMFFRKKIHKPFDCNAFTDEA